jgi:GAF domain-containing protein
VGIFLADEANNQLTLAATSSPEGLKMLARGHRLGIGREGIVGFAAYQKRPRLAQDVGVDTVYFNNPDLPDTHSEVALPLLAQNRLIGILDIQSKNAHAFSTEDVYTLQTMTDQIALAIENNHLMEQSRTSIINLELANTENTKTSWNNLLNMENKGFTYTPLGVFPISENRHDAVGDPEPEKTIKIPINLRGQKIGNISLKRKESMGSWSETEKEMAQQIAVQVAMAIENARLLQDSQRRAMREQAVNELSTRFSRSLDVDTLLQNAVRELHRLPQVAEVSILINPIEETQNPDERR